MSIESCGICGGDGRLSNSFGSEARCPGCHGTGRRPEGEAIFHDVTKTKPSHHKPANALAKGEKQTWPTTFEGGQLATEVKASGLNDDTKLRLTREIMEYEGTHGKCTQTFTKKIRKQLRPGA